MRILTTLLFVGFAFVATGQDLEVQPNVAVVKQDNSLKTDWKALLGCLKDDLKALFECYECIKEVACGVEDCRHALDQSCWQCIETGVKDCIHCYDGVKAAYEDCKQLFGKTTPAPPTPTPSPASTS